MAGITALQALNAIYLQYFDRDIFDTVNYEVPLMADIPKKNVSVVGRRETTFTYQTQLAEEGWGARLMREKLPNPGARDWKQVTVNIAYLYYRMVMEGQVEHLVKKPVALVDYMASEVDAAKKVITMQMARQVVSDGSGVIATITAVGATYIDVDDAKYIRPSAVFDAYGSDTPPTIVKRVPTTTYTATKVNRMTNRVTLTDVSNLVVGDKLYIYDSAYLNGTATAVISKEMTGIAAGIDDSNTYCGVDRTDDAFDFFRSTVDHNGGVLRDITAGLMEAFLDNMRRNGANPSMIKTSDGVRLAYSEYLRSISVPTEYVVKESGRGVLRFIDNGKPIELEGNFMMPKNLMYILSPDSCLRLVGKELGFIGKGPWQPSADLEYDAQYAAMSAYLGIFVPMPNKCGLIKDLREKGLADYHTT